MSTQEPEDDRVRKAVELADRLLVRWSYERLLLRQPHVAICGLYYHSGVFYAVCPDAKGELLAQDGKELAKWFSDDKAISAPVGVAAVEPQGAIRIPTRSAKELAQGVGEPKNDRDIYIELAMALPRDFPDFTVSLELGVATIHVAASLSEEQSRQLGETAKSACGAIPFEVDSPAHPPRPHPSFRVRGRQCDLTLAPIRRLPASVGRDLRGLYEEDEDFWVSHRTQVLSDEAMSVPDVLPRHFRPGQSRCLVDATVFRPTNIRTYLTLYQRVTLVMPLFQEFDDALTGWCATTAELVEMCRRGRIQFAVPQSVDRYHPAFLSRLAEEAPRSLLLSRRLAGATVLDARRRMPLLYPACGSGDRYAFLTSVAGFIDLIPGGQQREVIAGVMRGLSDAWIDAERRVHDRGAMGTFLHGYGPLVITLSKLVTKTDLDLEMMSACMGVEWAAALGATICPIEAPGFSSRLLTELFASIYSGVPIDPSVVGLGTVEDAVTGLLAVENDAPLVDVDDAFSGPDVDRFRELANGIVSASVNDSELAAKLEAFNERVRRYEKHRDRIRKLDVVGLGGSIAIYLLTKRPDLALLGTWMRDRIMKATPTGRLTGRVFDLLRGANAWTSSDVVLVSRLKGKLQD